MSTIVEEWISKAEADWHSANRDLRARKHPNFDGACFHAQQCAEKYLKGYLQIKDHRFGKTHNLISLMELWLLHESGFEFYRDILFDLNRYSVLIRYPGEEALKLEAKQAVDSLKLFRQFMRGLLNLPKD